MTQLPVRTLRNYVTRGLLTPTEFRGTATRYPRRELLRLLLAIATRKETKLTLAEIKQQLDKLDERALEARVRTVPLPAPVMAALGINPAPAAPDSEPPSDALARYGSQLETWQRIQLLPGLELMLGPKASLAAKRAASKICGEYLG